jgi:hypothetical protein
MRIYNKFDKILCGWSCIVLYSAISYSRLYKKIKLTALGVSRNAKEKYAIKHIGQKAIKTS